MRVYMLKGAYFQDFFYVQMECSTMLGNDWTYILPVYLHDLFEGYRGSSTHAGNYGSGKVFFWQIVPWTYVFR